MNLYKILKFIVKPIIKIVFPYKVSGLENIAKLKDDYIVYANHLSNIDPIFLAVTNPRQVFFLAKDDLFKNKFSKKFFMALGVIPISRGQADSKALETASSVLYKKEVLGIFIEGTRSKTGEFLRPKSGVTILANKCKTRAVPICITGSAKDNRIHIFRRTYITYGKPIDFSGEQLRSEIDTMDDLRQTNEFLMSQIRILRK